MWGVSVSIRRTRGVGFLGAAPGPEGRAGLAKEDFGPNEVRFAGREVYLWCPNGVQDSPFARVDWDKQLGVPVTMRNWKTVATLLEMVRSRASTWGSR